MQRVAVVDYGMGNLDSVRRALEECGAAVSVVEHPEDLRTADKILLPGVGAFGEAMARLRSSGMDDGLRTEVIDGGAPFLGICLGMQLIMATGSEGGPTDGLGWIDGTVERLVPKEPGERVPHVGWNELHRAHGATLLEGILDGADVYFVHSYRVLCTDDRDVAATTPFCGGFTSMVERANVHTAQFHPEKSQQHGFAVLRNFLAL